MRLLPYTPLSLDAHSLKPKDHRQLTGRIVLMDSWDNKDPNPTQRALRECGVTNRNRLMADLLGFLELCERSLGVEAVKRAATDCDLPGLLEILKFKSDLLCASYARERETDGSVERAKMWSTWFETILVESDPTYVPPHVWFFLQDESDWDEQMYSMCCGIVSVACRMFRLIVS